MHYACGLRNAPALQFLLNSSVDPRITDAHGHTAVQWARRFGFEEGEALIARVTGTPLVSTPPHQTVPPGASSIGATSAVNVDLPFAGNVPTGCGQAGVAVLAPLPAPAQAPAPPGPAPMPDPDSELANVLSSSLPPFHPLGAHPAGATRSLEQFLEPRASCDLHATATKSESSLAGFLTAAAHEVERSTI